MPGHGRRIVRIGAEILTWIDGDAGPAGWRHVVPEAGLAAFARLLRAYHDAIRGYAGAGGDVMCHGDFGPWNIVWRDRAPAGILDWDHAHPAPPIHDVAYALEYAAPFRADEECVRWLAYAAPPDRRRRVEVFAEAYGLASTAGLVDAVLEAQAWTVGEVRRLARMSVEPQASWVREGHLEELARRMRWTEEHRASF